MYIFYILIKIHKQDHTLFYKKLNQLFIRIFKHLYTHI